MTVAPQQLFQSFGCYAVALGDLIRVIWIQFGIAFETGEHGDVDLSALRHSFESLAEDVASVFS